MEGDEREEKMLRSVALQNAQSILLARQRAEQALERKTEELAHSLAMMRATLESTTDAILVTDEVGRVTGFNRKYVEMWRVPSEVMDVREHRQILQTCARQFADPGQFLARVEAIYASAPPESYDLLELAGIGLDGGHAFAERQIQSNILGNRGLHKVRDPANFGGEVQWFDDEAAAAGIGKHLRSELCHALAGLDQIAGV